MERGLLWVEQHLLCHVKVEGEEVEFCIMCSFKTKLKTFLFCQHTICVQHVLYVCVYLGVSTHECFCLNALFFAVFFCFRLCNAL